MKTIFNKILIIDIWTWIVSYKTHNQPKLPKTIHNQPQPAKPTNRNQPKPPITNQNHQKHVQIPKISNSKFSQLIF